MYIFIFFNFIYLSVFEIPLSNIISHDQVQDLFNLISFSIVIILKKNLLKIETGKNQY